MSAEPKTNQNDSRELLREMLLRLKTKPIRG